MAIPVVDTRSCKPDVAPSLGDRFLEGNAVVGDVASVARNLFQAIGRGAVAVAPLTVVGGGTALIGGGASLYRAGQSLQKAYKEGDEESGAFASANLVSGAALSVLGVDLAVKGGATLAHAAPLAAKVGAIVPFVVPVLYGVVGLMGVGQIAISARFRRKINRMLSTKDSQETKLKNVLEFLKAELGARADGKKQSQLTRRTSAQQVERLNQRLDDCLASLNFNGVEGAVQKCLNLLKPSPSEAEIHEVRVAVEECLKFFTSSSDAQAALRQCLDGLNASPEAQDALAKCLKSAYEGQKKGAIEEAYQLVQGTLEENFKSLTKGILFLIIGIIGLVASAAIFTLSGPVVPALFVVGALLWLLLDSSWVREKSHNLFWKMHHLIWPESGVEVQEKECTPKSPTFSTFSNQNGDSQGTPSKDTDGISQHSDNSS